MNNFCTLFDSFYIHKGIALYLSLEKVCKSFHLYIMAFDEDCYDKLKSLNLSNMIVEFEGGDFENNDIKKIKQERKKNEFCWTCGSNITYYFLTKYQLDDITYLDADMMFFSSPDIIFNELEHYSIGLSPHFANNKYYGTYCVQFVYFKNNGDGLKALTWWKNCCIDWCYDRYEDGKFGDQRYLDIMQKKFKGVHPIENRGVGVSQWNMLQYKFLPEHRILYKNRLYDVCFYHFHAIAVNYVDGNIIIESKKEIIPQNVIDNMFKPYGLIMKDVYEKYLGKMVRNIIIKNPGLFRKYLQYMKNILRDNKLIQYLFFKYIKGHSGYNKKQL